MAAPIMKKFFVIFTFDNILLKCSSSLLTHSTNKLEHLILISLSDIPAYLLEAPVTNKEIWTWFLINTLLKFSSSSLTHSKNKLEHLLLASLSKLVTSRYVGNACEKEKHFVILTFDKDLI
jgi:hypothetical protein